MEDLKTHSAKCLLEGSCRSSDYGSAELCVELGIRADRTETATLTAHVESLYLQQHDSLFRFLLSTGCPRELAPDLLQEGFCRLFESLSAGKKIDKPRSWLVQVLYNLFLNHLRKHRRESEFDETWAATAEWKAEGCNPEKELRAREREQLVRRAMEQLTPSQSRYLSLRAEGLKFREIGELCGVATATVAESCARALQKIRAVINE